MKKILVVDNNPVILKFMQHLLEKNGHDVETAHDGLSALSVLTTFSPDVCFIDLIMENISGDKLCQIIRSLPEHEKTFLVILSAVAAEDRVSYKKYDADAFIAKGPIKQMSGHISHVLELLDTPDKIQLKNKVLGVDEIFYREITKELLDSKNHYEAALRHISEGFLEILDNKIIYANPAARSLLGIPEEKLLNSNFIDIFENDSKALIESSLASAIQDKQPVEITEPIRIENNLILLKIIPVDEDKFQSTLVIMGDVTRQKHLESQLQHAQKMEAIGTLAGGVAHDLNNVLSGIVSYPDLLLTQLPENSPLREAIQTIKKSGKKAASIVQDLLTLARRGVSHKETVNLNNIVAEYLSSPECDLLKTYHPEVDFKFVLDDNLLNCTGSALQLSKTIMNLISNGAEAITDKGTVTVTTKNHYVDNRSADEPEAMKEGEYISLIVSDDGVGISNYDKERIFEPFYTKKKMGRSGTGLGMSVVWGSVKDHDGFIDVKSTSGEGTSIKIYLPASRREVAKISKKASLQEFMGKNESILIVDDMKNQREIASETLKVLGYNVFSLASGEEAIAFLQHNNVDLVILDMLLEPGMDGLDTYKKIIEMKPVQKVLFVSGYAESLRIQTAQELGAGAYIQKPYTLEQIGRAVKAELDKFSLSEKN